MKLITSRFGFFLVSLLSLVAGVIFMHADDFGLCSVKVSASLGKYWYCFFSNYGDLTDLGWVLVPMSLSVLMVSFLLLFMRNSVFSSWFKFALFSLPLIALLIYTTPENSNSWMPLYFIGRGTVTEWTACLFVIVSLVIIVWKQFNLGKKLV